MAQLIAAGTFVAGALVLAAGFVFAARGARSGPVPYEEVAHRGYQVRAVWFGVLTLTLALLLTAGLQFYPYPSVRAAALGQPDVEVKVAAVQYAWKFEPDRVPAGRVIVFAVSSEDVNHGFGVYGPDGSLVGQVQAMPGYTNRLWLRLDRPGTYRIRCLEYCGVGHSVMTGSFTVAG